MDFVITNPRHHLGIFAPVIAQIRAAGLRPRILSLCELRGYRTPAAEFSALGAEWIRLMPVRLSKDSLQLRAVRDRAMGRTRRWLRDAIWHGLVRRRLGGSPAALAVVPNDTAFPYDRVVQLFREEGVPFLLMQEGVRFELPVGRRGQQYGQGGAHAVAAWGEASVRYFRSVGVPADRIRAVGNPRLDTILARDWTEAARSLRRTLDLPDRVLLLVTNPIDLQGFCSAEDKYRLISAFLAQAAPPLSTMGISIVIKIHPSESLPAYTAMAAASAGGARVVRDADPFALFHLSAAVVVLGSTAGLEAMLFDVPVGVLEVPGIGFLHDYVDFGAAVPLRAETARADVENLLADGETRRAARRRYLGEQLANLGHAAEAAGALIGALVEKRVVA
ncbi:MAG TPA: hypothetical protein VGK88_10920 [bacterium]